jgi:hypothetical protein
MLAGEIEDVALELTPQERRRLEKQKEMEADLDNAADLLGSASVEGAFAFYHVFILFPILKRERCS